MLLRVAFCALGLVAASAVPSAAQSLMAPQPFADIVDEIRIGIHAHDVSYAALPFKFDYDLSQIEDLSFDVLFTSPDIDAFRWIGSPRPDLGVTINLDGQDSLAHLGLTWHLPVFDTPFYVEGTFGGAVHNAISPARLIRMSAPISVADSISTSAMALAPTSASR